MSSNNWRSLRKALHSFTIFRSISIAVALMIITQGVAPLLIQAQAQTLSQTTSQIQGRQDSSVPGDSTVQEIPAPPIDAATQEQIETFATAVSTAITLRDNGTAAIKDDAIVGLDRKAAKLLRRGVEDLNAGRLGIAFVNKEGTAKLYGSFKALAGHSLLDDEFNTQTNTWVDWAGVHLYVDGWWARQIEELNGYAIGFVIGLAMTAICGTGVGCIAASFVVGWFWSNVVWGLLRPYLPTAFTLNFPWWGYAQVQLWKPGAWFNGRSFRTSLWT